MRGKVALFLVSAVLALSACGGGDNRVVDLRPPPGSNHAPIADAGADQTIALAGTRIILDGSKSSDPDGTKLTYSWSIVVLPPKSAAVLVGANTVRPSVTLDVEGEYKFGLIVSDGELQSEEATVKVTVGKGGNGGGDGGNPGDGGGDTGLGPVAAVSVSSTSFADGGTFPNQYANTAQKNGLNISPAVSISNFPAETTHFAIVMDAKCDSAVDIGCVMWGVFNIPLTMTNIKENDPSLNMTPGIVFGAVAGGSRSYWGPGGGGSGFSDYNITLNVYALTGAPIPYPGKLPFTSKSFEAAHGKQIIGKGTMKAFYRNQS